MSNTPRTPRQVLIHVGHGKTGSSFLQSALANSIEVLEGHGIVYPMLDPAEVERVRAGGISGGNLPPAPARLNQVLQQGWAGDADRLLISGESYFHKLRPTIYLEKLRARLPDADVRVLLYVRDPLDHAVSKYQQAVKRAGYTEDFETALTEYNTPGNVGQFLAWLEGEMGVPVQVINYSRHRDTLMDTFEDWLEVPKGTLVAPPVASVNRSLTNSETELQRLFNVHFGEVAAEFVTDPLCALLPDIRSERPAASPEALEAFLKAMRRMIKKHALDARLGADEAYQLPTLEEAVARFSPPDPDATFQFSGDQLRVFVDAIRGEIERAAAGEGATKRAQARTERKAAQKARMIESRRKLARKQAKREDRARPQT